MKNKSIKISVSLPKVKAANFGITVACAILFLTNIAYADGTTYGSGAYNSSTYNGSTTTSNGGSGNTGTAPANDTGTSSTGKSKDGTTTTPATTKTDGRGSNSNNSTGNTNSTGSPTIINETTPNPEPAKIASATANKRAVETLSIGAFLIAAAIGITMWIIIRKRRRNAPQWGSHN
jgi:hypothetical protein